MEEVCDVWQAAEDSKLEKSHEKTHNKLISNAMLELSTPSLVSTH